MRIIQKKVATGSENGASSSSHEPPDANNRTVPIGSKARSCTAKQPKKHKTSPPALDDGYNSADEYIHVNRIVTEVYSEVQFESELKEKRGYYIKKVKEDGNCLFRAIADQVYGDEEMHSVVRGMCMDYMLKERDHFSQFVTEDFDAYVARKREDKCYGNNVEMQAFTEVFGRAIEVYSGRGDVPINIFNGSYTTDNSPIMLSYHGGNHYNSVIDPSNPSVGVGLGLPDYKPIGEGVRVAEAIKVSEQEYLEQRFIEETKETSELSIVEKAIEDDVIAASTAEYIASLLANVQVPAVQM
jgi:OTU domain-containing protein 5